MAIGGAAPPPPAVRRHHRAATDQGGCYYSDDGKSPTICYMWAAPPEADHSIVPRNQPEQWDAIKQSHDKHKR